MKNLASVFRWSLMTIAVFAFGSASAQMFWNEDFEADNAGVTYTLSTSDGLQFSDGGTDFFTQIPSGSVSGGYVVTGQNNTGYFAAQDTDAEPTGAATLDMLFDDVSIAGESNLELRILVAEDDDGANQDWDAGDQLLIEVDIDNSGVFTPIMSFAQDGTNFNAEPGFDTDLDGVLEPGEGPFVTDTFAEFTAAIAGTGSVIDIRISFIGMSNGDEDVAIDYVQLWNASVPTVPGCTDNTACNFDNTANQDDGSCFFVGDSCDDNDVNTTNDTIQGDCGCAGTVICTPAPMWTAAEVVTNNGFNANGAWETIAGGFSVNGFCGGGCQEAVDTWIVSNGFDFTGVPAAELVFDVAENFGTTDLNLQYTTSYNGDPSASVWTSLLVITDGGSEVVDLSTLNGLTEVYLGFQYLDDGADGYSDWEVTNIDIIGDCPAEIAVFDCPVEMANIGDPCDDLDPITTGDVIQGDCSCAGTPAFDCPVELANIGDPCDDLDPNTTGDVIQGDCSCAGTPVGGCTPFYTEDFEVDGAGSTYILSTSNGQQFSDGSGDFFTQVPSGTITGSYQVTGQNGTGYFAAMDTDGDGEAATLTLTIDDIDITGQTGLELSLLVAEDDDGANQDWDDNQLLIVQVDVDNSGVYTPLIQFATAGNGTNEEPGLDANLDGSWDGVEGPALSDAFQSFSASIPSTGSTLDVQIVFQNFNAGDEDAAIDFIQVCGGGAPVSGCTTEAACNYDPSAAIDDGSCLFPGDACDDGNANTTGDVFGGDCACAGTPIPGDLIISEILYNPNDDLGFPDNNYEYVEIYNNSGASIDLEGYSVDGFGYTFAAGETIAAGEYVIVAAEPSFFTGNGYTVYGPATGGLSNSGETITLFDDLANIVDEVSFDDGGIWPIGTDGDGYSLELVDLLSNNNDGVNWQASCPFNGTPGAMNSTHPCDAAPTVTTINAIQSNTDANGASLDAGNVVEISGIVTGTFAGSTLFSLQDGTGAHSGIWVEGDGVAEGDQITVQGTVLEWFDLTIVIQSVITVNTQGNALPAPEVLGTLAVNDEQWEGVLVETTGDVVNGDAGFGEWIVDDLTGEVRVDDLNGNAVTPLVVGDTYTVTGPLYFSFSNFKIEPRDNAQDIRKWGCTDDNFLNYDADAVIDDGNCGNNLGCNDSDADNFDPAADANDGSCIYSGCTDDTALNYDIQANNDDGSCYFTLPNIVINEIHYNPCGDQGDDNIWEFAEFYNAEATSVDLSGYVISQGVDFTFPEGTTIAAGEYIIIAYTASSYTGNGYQVFEWDNGGLSNGGETLELSDAFGNVVDSVPFDDANSWPAAADGDCPSLELIDPALDNSLPENWQASFVSNGTPGAVNSTLPPSTSYTIFEIQSDIDGGGASNIAGQFVTTSGIVTAVYPGEGVFTIQDGTGPYSGIWVAGTGVSLGDEVDVTGTVIEDFGNTIISPAAVITVLTSGNPLPATEVLTTSAMNDEQWEGVLLETTGVVQNGDAGFGEWSIDDGSGLALVHDYGINVIPVDEGIQFTVVGPSLYSFGNWKLEPRDLNDIQRWGCTDNSFLNFDPAAVIDDGNCSNAPGCTDPEADNYDPAAGFDDGSCQFVGCDDPAALNFDPQVNAPDNSLCYFTLPNLVINEIHYNPCAVQGDDFDWEFVEIYNAEASSVNLEGFTFTNGFEFTFPAGATIAAGEYIIIAVNAASYLGNGYQVFEIATGNLSNGGETLTLEDGFGNEIDEVTYSDASPWPFEADGSCVSLELIDPALDNNDGNNWQGSFVFDGTPGAQNSQQISGCTDPTACNYDPAANDDDGSCDLVSCLGCTYVDADNYDATATVDDGSCTFSNPCPADLNEDGLVNSSDLLQFLGQFGTICP